MGRAQRLPTPKPPPVDYIQNTIQYTEHDNRSDSPTARNTAAMFSIGQMSNVSHVPTYQVSNVPCMSTYRTHSYGPMYNPYVLTICRMYHSTIKNVLVQQPKYNQQFCYSNYPIKCSTAVQLIHTGRYHEQSVRVTRPLRHHVVPHGRCHRHSKQPFPFSENT